MSAANTRNLFFGRPRLPVRTLMLSSNGITCSLSLPLAGVVQLA
nr:MULTISPECIES: hypothetical protein [unclassified Moorena]